MSGALKAQRQQKRQERERNRNAAVQIFEDRNQGPVGRSKDRKAQGAHFGEGQQQADEEECKMHTLQRAQIERAAEEGKSIEEWSGGCRSFRREIGRMEIQDEVAQTSMLSGGNQRVRRP